MDANVLAAIITSIGVIVAAIIGYVAVMNSTRGLSIKLFRIDRDRRAALKGKWEGIAHQEVGPPETLIDYRVKGELKATSRRVYGEATMDYELNQQKISESIEVNGGFIHDRFLKLEYKIKDIPGLIRFGFLLLEFSPDGKMLDGRFMSYGAEAKAIVWGSIKLHKTN